MKNNTMNKFVNQNVRIYQGRDPNTELKETGILLDKAYFQEQFSISHANPIEIFGMSASQFISSEINSLGAPVTFSENNNTSNSLGLPAVNYAQPINMSGSSYPSDFISGLSGGSITPELLNADINADIAQPSPAAGGIGNRSFGFAPTASGGGNSEAANTDTAFVTNSNAEDPQVQSPIVTVSGSVTNEGDPIPLSISVATDPRPGVVTTITLTGVPSDASLSAGTKNANGTWTLSIGELAGLQLLPDPHTSGEITLSVTAVSSLDGYEAGGTGNFKVTIEGESSVPGLSVQSASGMEDTPISLNIHSWLTDNDGSETLTVKISGVPAGASLSAGVNNHDGSWTLTETDLANLKLNPPANFNGAMTLNVEATSTENGTSSTTHHDLNVTVSGIADVPNLAVNTATGNENTNIMLNISASLADAGGTETLSVIIAGLPVGASLTAGIDNGDGTWTLTPAQLANLALVPPANFSGDFDLTVLAVSQDHSTFAYKDATLSVHIDGVAATPNLSTSPANGLEDTPIALTINASSTDTDGSEAVSITISGVPVGASLSAGTNTGAGVWTLTPADLTNLKLTPPADFSGTINLTVTAAASEDGTTATITQPLAVTILGVPDLPSVSVQTANGAEGTAISLNITANSTDADQSEVISVTVTGVPAGASLSAGVNNGNGTWTLSSADLTNLKLTPAADFSGSFNLGVTATATENGQSVTTPSTSMSVNVSGVATIPNLSVLPASGNEDTAISLNISASLNDSDGSETLSVTVSGIPAGAALSAGTNNGNGTWTLAPADLTNLSLTPPANYSGTFNLTVTAISSENGTTAPISLPLAVSIAGVPDQPSVSVQAAVGSENSGVALHITPTLADTDGSETLTVTISGVPIGASLSAGTDNGNGNWTLSASDLTNLTLTPPNHYSGNFNLSIVATASENGLSNSSAGTNLSVNITPVADAPILTVHTANGNEDTSVALSIDAQPFDVLGSEVLTIEITGVPNGATLSAGVDNGNGSWSLIPSDLNNLSLNPPANYSGSFALNVTLISTAGLSQAQVNSPLTVNIGGVPDMPSVGVQPASGNEGSAITLIISGALTDTDGSETLSFSVTGVPIGATLSAGTNQGGGVWTLTPAQLSGLKINPPANYSGSFSLGVIATASENGQSINTSSSSLNVAVAGVATQPNLVVQNIAGNEDSPILLNIASSLVDNDGSEALTIQISGVPAGASLSAGVNNGNGNWTLTSADLTNLSITPPANYSGNFNLNVTATSSENSTNSSVSLPMTVTVGGVPDVPTLSVQPASGNENAAISLNISPALVDTDGSETLSITISGVPVGATLSAGANQGGGVWLLTPAQLSGLTLNPPNNYSGTFSLSIIATATENGQFASTTSSSLSVSIAGVASAPTLILHAVTGNEDTTMALNINAALTDTDGSETLSVKISGVPSGATLSAGTNNGGGVWTLSASDLTNLKLTPASNYSGIINLSVSATSSENGTTSVVSGPMSVTVSGVPDAPTLNVQSVTGNEDSNIPLTITSHLTDTDGSEVLSITVSGVPAGAHLSAGRNNGDGTWSLSPSDLSGLTLTPAANWAGVISLSVTAVSTENNGHYTSVTSPATITVLPQADAPSLSLLSAIGKEDTAIPLSITSALGDIDGSENLTIKISGVPTGALLSAGTNNGGGTWTLTSADLANLKITPPYNSDVDFNLTVKAIATDSNGTTNETTGLLAVTVTGSADIPTVTAVNTTGAINTLVSVNVSGAVTDSSETLTYLIKGVPDGFSFNQGTNNGNNSWTLSPADLSGLKLISPYNFEGRVNMTAYAVSHDGDGDVAQSLGANFNIGVGNAAAGIQLNLGLGIGTSGINLGLGLSVSTGSLLNPGGLVVMEDAVTPLTDANLLLTLASGISYLTVSGLPAGASLSAGVDLGGGSYKLSPGQLTGLNLILPPNSDQDFTLSITAKLAILTVTLATTAVHVIGIADIPTLSVANATGTEDGAAIPIAVTSALTDTDGSETLSFTLSNLPTGFTPTVGINNGNGTWTLTATQIASLAIKTPTNWSGDATYTITATSTEREGDSTIKTITGNIHVNAVADAPLVSPIEHHGQEDTPLSLNFGIALKDTDGSETISAVKISGLANGFSLTGATDNHDGTWSVDPAHLNNVKLVAPHDWSGDTSFTVTATSRETATGATATTSSTVHAHFDSVADTPTASASDVTGVENNPIDLNISAFLNDTDGSEHLSVVISNVPDHFTFTTGLNNGDGTWSFNKDEIDHVQIIPEHNFTGDVNLHIDVFAQDDNYTVASAHDDFTLHVMPDT